MQKHAIRHFCNSEERRQWMDNNIIADKSKKFAIRIVNLYKILVYDKNETVMSKQLLRSGTSIGANIAEAVCSISKKDFLSKMYIAFKECSETVYWIELLYETKFINYEEYVSIYGDCTELKRILSSITKTAKEKMDN